jgi:hypothetical protein
MLLSFLVARSVATTLSFADGKSPPAVWNLFHGPWSASRHA